MSAAGKDGVRGNPGKSVFGRRAGLASLSQISITLDLYSHAIPVLQNDAAGRMDLALGG